MCSVLTKVATSGQSVQLPNLGVPPVTVYSICVYTKLHFLQMTSTEITELLARMGVASEEGVGIPYHSLVHHLAQVLENRQ